MSAVADLLDRARVARIRRALRDGERPQRLGLVLDCSDLRATSREPLDAGAGHSAGAAHADDLLYWCEEWDIDHLVVHVVTAGVLRRGQGGQVGYLRGLVEAVVADTVAGPGESWRLEVAGDVSRLPTYTIAALRLAAALTRSRQHQLTVSIGHPGEPAPALDAADLVLTPPLPLGLTERELAEALLEWSRTEVGRAG
ncbi:undecaprenyl diphosphate synthase family protein [Oryzihumus leptocrescens]|uniref:Putative undecaprenyl diphosphate synthase n=1 Tax=Oryzihumus leptocrescens TaxID=297536 RepID=A0A542ZLI1_9MICO|nr:undecaprenyl diphosphate synthase family protein [Oryzihumus leptocrescens]TQL61205.1 putative undecaprenyl diphosphate synthase [Oryzihumus leptocrescens]